MRKVRDHQTAKPARKFFSINGWDISFALFALILIGISILRSLSFPLTHDEALSFMIFNGNPSLMETANHHFINTFLMRVSSHLFGTGEFSIRLPNIFAHAVYLGSSILLAKKFSSRYVQLATITFLNLNLFALDFFFLARGYGLAMAFQLFSIYIFIEAREAKQEKRKHLFVLISVLSGILAVFSNFAFLNFFIPLFGIHIWCLITDESCRKIQIRSKPFPFIFGLLIISALALLVVYQQMMMLRKYGELYFGGTNGFISDTLYSLVDAFLYTAVYSQTVRSFIVILIMAMYGLCLAYSFYSLFLTKSLSSLQIFTCILTITILLPIVQFKILGTRFPIGRAALYYVPLVGLLISFFLYSVESMITPTWRKVLSITVIVMVSFVFGHFILNYKTNFTYSWSYEAHNKQVISLITNEYKDNSLDEPVNVGIHWYFEPSMNYYRIHAGLSWLAPFHRAGFDPSDVDYIYTFSKELSSTPRDFEEIFSFSDTEIILLRRKNLLD